VDILYLIFNEAVKWSNDGNALDIKIIRRKVKTFYSIYSDGKYNFNGEESFTEY